MSQKTRLVQKIKEMHPHLSHKWIKTLITDKKVLVNQKTAKLHQWVNSNDSIFIEESNTSKTLKPNSNLNCTFLKTTSDYYFIEKPKGIHSVALNFKDEKTVANWLLSQDADLNLVTNPLEAGLMQRLDKEVSGVLVAARNQKAASHFKNLLKKHEITKIYQCITTEQPPKPNLYEAQIISKRHSKRLQLKEYEDDKNPVLKTEIISSEKHPKGYLVTLSLISGFRHQIRSHMAFLKCPLLGDELYQGKPADRLYLHSTKIFFKDLNGKGDEVISSSPF